MLDPVLDEFGALLRSIKLSKPAIAWVSNRTGTWITAEQATDPQYWVDHLRGTVRFADCVATLAAEPGRLFLEVGPGKTLSSLARMNPAVTPAQAALPVLRHADEVVPDDAFLVAMTGRMWATGGQVDTAGYALYTLELGGWKPDATTEAERRGRPPEQWYRLDYLFTTGAQVFRPRTSNALSASRRDEPPSQS